MEYATAFLSYLEGKNTIYAVSSITEELRTEKNYFTLFLPHGVRDNEEVSPEYQSGYRLAVENMVVAVGTEHIHHSIAASPDRRDDSDVLRRQPFPLECIEFLEWVFFGRVQDIRDGLWPRRRC